MSDANESDVKRGTSASLVAGMCDSLRHEGYECGGFDVWCTSQVLEGSGLSSSASFEVFVGTVINHLFNCGSIDPVTVARAAQRAENVFFGKPCGLMDQTACAVGGFVFIDFEDPQKPVVRKLSHDLADMGMLLCITDTGGSHADLTDDYASIPAEMKAGSHLNSAVPCSAMRTRGNFTIRSRVCAELARIARCCVQLISLRKTGAYLRLPTPWRTVTGKAFSMLSAVPEIRRSSIFKICIRPPLRSSRDSRWRLRSAVTWCVVYTGGGFAGTVQAFLDPARLEQYRSRMESVFGAGSCRCLNVRSAGAARLL